MSNPSPSSSPASGTPTQRPDGQPGGMASTADAGLTDALQRSAERGDDTATGLASTGNASGGGQAPRTDLGGKNEPGSAPGATGPSGSAAGREQAGTTGGDAAQQGATAAGTRGAVPAGAQTASGGANPHAVGGPVHSKDESPLESFGQAVSEVVTGSAPDPAVPTRHS